ncbi:hypothetical protein ACFYY9_19140 [Streptomyces nigra]|uniref:hypothetical protein n=1 Tax=Streptomyces nigra TaxID=1827580 RepID=UPI0036C4A383
MGQPLFKLMNCWTWRVVGEVSQVGLEEAATDLEARWACRRLHSAGRYGGVESPCR